MTTQYGREVFPTQTHQLSPQLALPFKMVSQKPSQHQLHGVDVSGAEHIALKTPQENSLVLQVIVAQEN